PFNWHPGRVFLGDGGAYLVGAVIATGVTVLRAEDGIIGSLAAGGFMGMFVVDLIVTVGRRFQRGSRLFAGDRGHVYDRLVFSGRSLRPVSRLLVGGDAAFVAATPLASWPAPGPAGIAVAGPVGMLAITMTWRVASRPPATND